MFTGLLKKEREIVMRLRELVEATVFICEDARIPVTVSLGVATRAAGAYDQVNDLIAAADRFLYYAKERGRNRVAIDHEAV